MEVRHRWLWHEERYTDVGGRGRMKGSQESIHPECSKNTAKERLIDLEFQKRSQCYSGLCNGSILACVSLPAFARA